MILKNFSYRNPKEANTNFSLEIDPIALNQINLIVGKNSVGKSTLTHSIHNFCRMITQKIPGFIIGKHDFTFTSNKGDEIHYEVDHNGRWIEEKLTLGEEVVLERTLEKTRIKSFTNDKKNEIAPPNNKLVLQVRRDKKEYPFFEDIVSWAENTSLFKFGLLSPEDLKFRDRSLDRTAGFIDVIPYDVKQMDENDKKLLFQEMALLDYSLEKLGVENLGRQNSIIYIFEKGIEGPLFHPQLSQGMLRTLFLLIFVNARIKEGKMSTLIIDDLCEGLDFERAKKLGKLLLRKIQDTKIQLIATSNDNFLMDVFPIKYWNILTREKSMIKTANYQNNKEKFDEFKFTGLSNFDLFSSDYLMENK